ncbi:MAG: 2'-5' RNA ligase family protein [Micrococcaceae bacterium]
MRDKIKERRVGVIIELPEPYYSEIKEYRWSFGDHMAHVVPPHVTLVSSTVLTSLKLLKDHVAKVAAQFMPITLELHGTDTFRPEAPVVYLKVVRGYEQCKALAEALSRGLLKLEPEFPYHPHVTVAFKVSDEKLDEAQEMLKDYSVEFKVKELKVFEHQEEDIWHIVKEIPLGANQPLA